MTASEHTGIVVRPAGPADEAAWRHLWAGYTAFYETVVPEEVTAFTWRRILDPASPMFSRVALIGERIAGFSVSVLHEGTWTMEPICYLEDLFVAQEARGRGLGAALIRDLLDSAKTEGWGRVYWHTTAGNSQARALYNKFCQADDYVRYRLTIR